MIIFLLFLTMRGGLWGWRCGDCEASGESDTKIYTCPECGSSNVGCWIRAQEVICNAILKICVGQGEGVLVVLLEL